MKNKYFKTRIIAKAQIRNMSKRSKSAALDEAIIDIVPVENKGEENEYISDQPDLMMVESVLVSTGMNGNDDVFLPSELMEIRSTGKHKPVNIEHDDNRVVGHIVESFPTTKEGERIEEEDINDPVKMPSSFDLTNRAVVYAYVFPNLAHEIREEASNNQLFVSVEVWYKGYDYLVGNSIVERNERTVGAFDPVLRMNGGTGYVNGMKVGKVLRDMLIAGVGLVANPANEESVIKSVSNSDKEISETVSQDFIDKFRVEYFNSEETVMKKSKAGEEKVEASVVDEQSEEQKTTETLDKIQEVEEKVEAKVEEVKDNAQTEDSDTENQSQEETVTETEATEQKVEETEDVDQIDEATASEDSAKEEVSENVELTDEISKLTEALAEATAKLDKLEAEKLNERRISEVVKTLSVDITKAKKLVDKSIGMDNDAFSSHLQDLLELFSKSASEKVEEEVKEEEVKDEKVEEPTEEVINEPKEEVIEESKEEVIEEPVVEKPVVEEPVIEEPKEEIKEEVKEEVVVEDTAIEEAVDEVLDNAEKEKEVVEFKENKEDDDLEAKFAEVVKKFIKQKEE